jgi:hypothetical protein
LLQAAAGEPQQPAPAPAPSQTEQPQAPTAQAHETTAAAPEPVHCRMQRVTGSRLAKRVCLTAHEMQTITDESRRVIDRAQREMPAPERRAK